MMAVQLLERWRSMLKKHLAVLLFILFALQPVLDVISFWTERLGMSTMPALLLRMLVLVCTCLWYHYGSGVYQRDYQYQSLYVYRC